MPKNVGLVGATKHQQTVHTDIQDTAIQPESGSSPYTKAKPKKCTFNLPEDLHYRLKLAAVTSRREMTDILIDALEAHLKAIAGHQ